MTLAKITEMLTVLGSLAPFIAVGYYFGKLDWRVSRNTKDIKAVRDDVKELKESLGV